MSVAFLVPRAGTLALLLCALAAQEGKEPAPPPVDPYTQGEATAMDAAGYVSFGPFPFGGNHTNEDIERLLPNEALIWIETAHFRIGAALPSCEVGRRWKARVRKDLARLASALPRVQFRSPHFDPWLRAHLVAQRAEGIYEDVLRLLGREPEDFPEAPGHEPTAGADFLGLGPYLGMREKFTILLVREPASLAQYTAAYHGRATTNTKLHHDHIFGNAFYGAVCSGPLADDEAMHTHLAYHVADNLYTSYRCHTHSLPSWLICGLAHWHCRQVSTSVPVYDLRSGPGSTERDFLTWDRRWRRMLTRDRFEPLARFVERMDVCAFTMDDHLQSWAFVDYLVRARRDQTVRFFERMKDPFHECLRFPTDEELFDRQRTAILDAFGTDVAGLEQAWRKCRPTRVARR